MSFANATLIMGAFKRRNTLQALKQTFDELHLQSNIWRIL